MAMVKCSECGKDISDKAAACIGCGAPISPSNNEKIEPTIKCEECGKEISIKSTTCPECGVPIISTFKRMIDFNGNGKVDLDDLKKAWKELKEKTISSAKEAGGLIEETFKSKAKKDEEDLNVFSQEHGGAETAEIEESLAERKKFKAALESTIDLRFAEVMSTKAAPEKFLTYIDAQVLTASVRNIFKSTLTITPPQVEAACKLSEAILAPSAQEKQNLIKASVGLAGGTAGIGLVIAGVGSALGWGASAIAAFTAVFAGSSIAGPAGWIIAGVTLAAIAGYFATSSNKEIDTERFLKVLNSSTAKAVDAVWDQHGLELAKVVN